MFLVQNILFLTLGLFVLHNGSWHQDPMFTNVTCRSVYQGRTKNLETKIICLFRKCAENPQLSEYLCFKGKIFGPSILL